MFGFLKNIGKKNGSGFFLELKEEVDKLVDEAKQSVASASKDTKAPEAPAPSAPAAKMEAPTPAAPAAVEAPAKPSRKEAAAKPAPAPAKAAAPAVPAETNFATKYLMPTSSNGRRRPGANMSAYLDMARQVKTTVNK